MNSGLGKYPKTERYLRHFRLLKENQPQLTTWSKLQHKDTDLKKTKWPSEDLTVARNYRIVPK